MTLPVFVINRACDEARWSRFKQKARAQGVKPERIAAIDGHRPDAPFHLYADLIGTHFWGEDRIKPGALACYLSHRKAWEQIVARGLDRALICEDDVDLTEPTERLAAAADTLGAFDLLFANDRLAGGDGIRPLSDAVREMQAKAPGADCYLMTRRGAERMLALSARQKIVLRGGLGDAVERVGTGAGASRDFHPGQGPGAARSVVDRLRSRPAGLEDCAAGASSIAHSVTIPIAALSRQTSDLVHGEHMSHITCGLARLSFLGRGGSDPVMEAHRNGDLWESAALAALIRRFPEGGTFCDIGAHLGNHSVAMAVMAAARVISVEPNPEISKLLRMNIAMNRVEAQTMLRGETLGDKPGPGYLTIHRRKPAQTSLSPGIPAAVPPPDPVELPAYTASSKTDPSGADRSRGYGDRRNPARRDQDRHLGARSGCPARAQDDPAPRSPAGAGRSQPVGCRAGIGVSGTVGDPAARDLRP